MKDIRYCRYNSKYKNKETFSLKKLPECLKKNDNVLGSLGRNKMYKNYNTKDRKE